MCTCLEEKYMHATTHVVFERMWLESFSLPPPLSYTHTLTEDLEHRIIVVDGSGHPVGTGVTVDDIPDPLLKEPAETKMAPLTTVAHAVASLEVIQLQKLNQQVYGVCTKAPYTPVILAEYNIRI